MNRFGYDGNTTAKCVLRRTTDELPTVDVRDLKRAGSIAPGQERVQGIARLQWTPCSFGGSRPWFVCPGEGCGRRVAILYGPPGPRQLLLCRHCLDLAYPSQREDPLARAERRMIKALERLPPDGAKPKRMRHATFERLVQEYLEAKREHAAQYREWIE